MHEFIDDIQQIFASDNFKAVSHREETNGEKTHALFDEFSTSSVGASKGCTPYERTFRFNVISRGDVKYIELNNTLNYIEKYIEKR